jgi:hypothetical protein
MNGMSVQHLVNILGLVCDIFGAIVIWRFGLPESIDRKGAIYRVTGEVDKAEKAKAEKYDRFAKFGVCLIILGFIFQLISNFL